MYQRCLPAHPSTRLSSPDHRTETRNDTNFADRSELSIQQVIDLQLCLNSTYFVCRGVYYRQIQEAPMGSSNVPYNTGSGYGGLQRACTGVEHAPNPPSTWLRYVDDMFTVLRAYYINEFTHHLYSVVPHIQFTIKEGGQLPFLDTMVNLSSRMRVRSRSRCTENLHTRTSTSTGIPITI